MAKRARATIQQAKAEAKKVFRGETASGLGSVGWYDLTPGWTAPSSVVHAALSAYGLDPLSTIALPPDHASAFGRAVDRVRGEIKADGYTLKDVQKGTSGARRVAIVEEMRNGVYTALDVGTVACAPSSAFTAPYVERTDTPFAAEVAGRILAAERAAFDVYTKDDIRVAIVDAIDRCGGISCRQERPHVAYWIPGSGGDLPRLSDAVESIGAGCVDLFEGATGSARTEKAAVRVVNAGLEERLTAFAEQADKLISASSTRESTLQSMLEDSAEFRADAALYRSILGSAIVGIDDRIVKVDAMIRDRLMNGATMVQDAPATVDATA